MRRWQFGLGLIVSAFFLWLALRGLHLEAVWQELQEGNYWWLVPSVGVYFLAVLARTVPEMNILFISMPLRAGVGLLMTAMFVPFIKDFLTELADWMGRLLPL